MDKVVIGIDPGSDKCGVAVVDGEGICRDRRIVGRNDILAVLEELSLVHPEAVIVIGDGTGCAALVADLRDHSLTSRHGEPVVIDEYRSTEEARRLYLEENRRGWRKFIPLGLQTPDRPVDDYVAEVLARRYIQRSKER